jgi:hypothetical protein
MPANTAISAGFEMGWHCKAGIECAGDVLYEQPALYAVSAPSALSVHPVWHKTPRSFCKSEVFFVLWVT